MRAFWKSAIIQRLQRMHNPLSRSKIKIAKNMSKIILQIIYSCSVQKAARKNTKYSKNETILKINLYAILRLQPLPNAWFGSKIKIKKRHAKMIVQALQSSSVQKTARKKNQYSRNDTILKIAHHAMQRHNDLFGSNIKNPKNMQKSILKAHQSSSVQKTASKNT